MNVYQKLVEVRKMVPYLQKENSGSQYKYVSSSQVLAAVRAKMDDLGLLLVPSITSHKVTESTVEFKGNDGNVTKRTTTYFTELDMVMTWVNTDKPDETIACQWYGQGVDIAGEKGVGKAVTYAEKYFILKQFNIPTDKDDPDSFQADDEPPFAKLSDAQVKRAFAIAASKGYGAEALKKSVLQQYGKSTVEDLTKAEYDELCKKLDAMPNKKAS